MITYKTKKVHTEVFVGETVKIRGEEDHRYQISHVLLTVELSNLFSLLVYVEIFQNNKIELLVSKISGTTLFIIVCLFCRFLIP